MRTDTILNVDADTSGIDKVGRSIEEAMDTKVVEKFQDRVDDLNHVMVDLVEQQGDLTKAMSDVDKGTDAYTSLQDKLKGVESQTTATERAIKRMNAEIKRIKPADVSSEAPTTSFGQRFRAGAGRGIHGAGRSGIGALAGGSAGALVGAIGGGASQAASAAGAAWGGFAAPVAGATVLGITAAVAAITSAMSMFKDYEAYALQTGGMMSQLGTGGRGALAARSQAVAKGALYGMTPQESLSAAGQYYSARGGNMEEAGAGGFEHALALRNFGVGMGQSAQFSRQFRPGRGGIGDGVQALADATGLAVQQGLVGSEVGENISIMASTMQSMEQSGNRLESAQLLGLSAALGGTFKGSRAASAAGGFMQFAAQTGRSGPSSALQASLYRAAGFRSGMGPQAYAAASFKLQSPDAGLFATWLNQQMPRGIGGDAKAMMVQRLLSQVNINATPQEAADLAMGGPITAEGISGLKRVTSQKNLGQTGTQTVLGDEIYKNRPDIARKRLDVGSSPDAAKIFYQLQQSQVRLARLGERALPLLSALIDKLAWAIGKISPADKPPSAKPLTTSEKKHGPTGGDVSDVMKTFASEPQPALPGQNVVDWLNAPKKK